MADFPLATPGEAARLAVPHHSAPYDSANKDRGGGAHFRSLVLSTIAEVTAFGLVALLLHEFFHLATLQTLGGSGYITFNWDLGLTHFTSLPHHLWAVRLSGGLLTGAFLLLFFWYREYSSHSARNISREMAAFSWAMGHMAYAPIEMLGYSPAIEALAFGVGFGTAAAVYSVKLIESLPNPSFTPATFTATSERGVLP